MRFHYRNIVDSIFCAFGKMLQKVSSMYREEKEKRKKRSRHIAIALLTLRRGYFLTVENREKAADMRNKFATRIKRRKREWLRDCEGALKKFGYMKNGDSREETRDAVAGSCKFSQRA